MSIPSYLKFVAFPYPADSGGGGDSGDSFESESEQDLAQLNDEGSEEDESVEARSSKDTERKNDNRASTRRNRAATEEDSEDTPESDEEDEEAEETEDSDSEDEDDDSLEDDEITPIGDEEDKDQPAYARPPIKAIKEKYPNFFKEFPQLKAAFFGYPQYAELFADIDSAREAVAKAQEYETLETSIVGKGDPKLLLESLSENNPKALKKMVASFPEALRSIDQAAYLELANPIIEELLYHASAHGTKVGNKNLQLAARHIANFVFANGGEIPDLAKKAGKTEPSEAEVQLQHERETYAREKFQSALGDVVELIKPDMNAILNHKLDGLTGFERRQILKEARSEVDRILGNDKAFQGTLRALWKKAEAAGYSTESKSRIKRAWLDRAKLIAPAVRSRLRQEAISSRTGSKRDKASSEEQEVGSKVKFKVTDEKKTFPERGGKIPSGAQRRVLDPKKIDWRKTSDKDILDMK